MKKIEDHERWTRGVGSWWGQERAISDMEVERRLQEVRVHQDKKEDGQGEGKEKQAYLENVIIHINSL